MDTIILTAWKGGGYGLKISLRDRDRYLRRSDGTVIIELPDGDSWIEVPCNIDKNAFWTGNCREMISKEIGKWMQKNLYAPWEKYKPPKFRAAVLDNKRFRVLRRL